MFSDPITLFLALTIGSILGIMLWIFFYRFPIAIIIITFSAFIMRVIFNQEIIILRVGFYNVSLIDILSVYLLSIAITRLLFLKPRNNKTALGIIFFSSLLFISWLRGVFKFGLELSTNEFRIFLYFLAVLFFTITLNYSSGISRKFILWFEVTSAVLVIIAFLRWAMIALGITSSNDWLAPDGSMVRVITASATFLLLQLSIFVIYFRNNEKNKIIVYLIPLLIIVMIIVLQHRTIWAALIVAGVLFFSFKVKHPIGIILGILFTITIVVLLLVNSDFSLINLSGTSFDLSSLTWRVIGWKELLAPERFQTILDYIIGQPFGTGYVRNLATIDYAGALSPHNFFVQTFLNIGGLGLTIVFICYGWLLKLLWSQRNDLISCGFFILLSTQLVYFTTYSPSYEQGFILGMAILFVESKKDMQKTTINNSPSTITHDEIHLKPAMVES